MNGNGSAPGAGHSEGAVTNAWDGDEVDVIVSRPADNAPLGELGRGDASVIPPSAGRIVTRAVTRCAECGATTVHVFRDADGINGSTRRGACRHVYRLRVRRVLAQWAREAA